MSAESSLLLRAKRVVALVVEKTGAAKENTFRSAAEPAHRVPTATPLPAPLRKTPAPAISVRTENPRSKPSQKEARTQKSMMPPGVALGTRIGNPRDSRIMIRCDGYCLIREGRRSKEGDHR